MNGEHQGAESIGIIGSADGPTCVYIGGKEVKKPLKVRIRNCIYNHRRRKAERKIVAGCHTLNEVAAYAADTYGAAEVKRKTEETTVASRIYEIKSDGDCLEIEIDYTRDTFGVSFSGDKKKMKYFKKIAKDLYVYYGVSENDISKKTERYLSLLGILSM